MDEDEYIAFLEHKLRKLHLLVVTVRGIPMDVREGLVRVIAADSHVDIEIEGEM